MKRVLILTAVALLISGTGFAQITGSKHDFSSQGWGTTEICEPCHTPHNADTSVSLSPLWNHEVTAVASYTVYSSSTLNATVGQPSGRSKLCLSCHDGTVNLDAFGGATGSTKITGNALVGIDISDDHPISFPYTTALASADGGLVNPSLAGSSGLGSTIAADMLFSDSLECASCHDVHNAAGNSFLLLKANTASALCLTCHDK